MGCCGGVKVAETVRQLFTPQPRAKAPPVEMLLVIPQSPLTACIYCASPFADRLVRKYNGSWETQRWCPTCGLRYP